MLLRGVETALIRLSEQIALEVKPYGLQKLDQRLESPPEAAAALVALLATGKADPLSGHNFSEEGDPEEILKRADKIERDISYMPRMKA